MLSTQSMSSTSLTAYCEHQKKLLIDTNIRVTSHGLPVKKIFISNLSKRTKFKHLKKRLSKYGNVISGFIVKDQGRRNFGIVTFDTPAPIHHIKRPREFIQLHNRSLFMDVVDLWHQPDSIEYQYYNEEGQKPCEKVSNDQSSQIPIECSTTENSIQILNNDCLKHIFQQLPILDRIRIEGVCKRWKSLRQEAWSDIKKLDLSSTTGSIFSDLVTDTATLRKILRRCGKFLNEINLSDRKCELNRSTVNIIAKLCPNLQRIDINPLGISRGGISSLAYHCRNITHINLGPINNIRDKDLEVLFDMNPKLRRLNIYRCDMSGTCLLHLPLETMEEIILQRCSNLERPHLEEASKRCHNIKSLRLKCCNIHHNDVKTISTHCKNLKIFQFSWIWYLTTDAILHISKLSNLEVLIISGNEFILNEHIQYISSNCQQLTYLDISDCRLIGTDGIAAVATLQNLETLIMNNVGSICDVSLRNLRNLKKFECRACEFSDKIIIELLISVPELELLDLTFCKWITDATLKEAIAVTARRVNNKVLKIFIDKTRINLANFKTVTPLLDIIEVVS
ncbi:putative RNA-binding protein EEED8.10 [Nomia melanderi]|uniref:putative RNA-binding protein EEED8.10 n=1 Tax=Nomia melanderi TaxID=2448451 RepID=UPI003FCCB520